MAWSLLIKNGTVIDGSGTARHKADVAIAGDRIVAVAPQLPDKADRVIDATASVDVIQEQIRASLQTFLFV